MNWFKRQKVQKSVQTEKKCENQTLSFFYINPCVARAVINNKFKTKRVYSVYSNTDRSQLLTIACSQEHEERNKIMAQQRQQQQQHFIQFLFTAQAGASKLKLSRQREKGVSNTHILCAIGKFEKVKFDFSEPEARKFKAYMA